MDYTPFQSSSCVIYVPMLCIRIQPIYSDPQQGLRIRRELTRILTDPPEKNLGSGSGSDLKKKTGADLKFCHSNLRIHIIYIFSLYKNLYKIKIKEKLVDGIQI